MSNDVLTAEKPQTQASGDDFMSEKCCAICGCRLLTERPFIWFCRKCYTDWKEAIHKKEPWVMYLRNLESARRYKEYDMRKLGISIIYLGFEWDIDSDGHLTRRDGSSNGKT